MAVAADGLKIATRATARRSFDFFDSLARYAAESRQGESRKADNSRVLEPAQADFGTATGSSLLRDHGTLRIRRATKKSGLREGKRRAGFRNAHGASTVPITYRWPEDQTYDVISR